MIALLIALLIATIIICMAASAFWLVKNFYIPLAMIFMSVVFPRKETK